MTEAASSISTSIAAVERAGSRDDLLQAVRDLAALTNIAAADTLITVLGYNNPGAAVAAVEGLVALGDAVVPSLIAQLDGYDYGARAWTIRALAGIGHPDGLETLLEAARGDFALSVRRAAAKGLGNIRWQLLDSPAAIAPACDRTLQTLWFVCEDPEWIVRYAAIFGLQGLANRQPTLQAKIRDRLQQRLQDEPEAAVRARIELALTQWESR